jgi:hypothetical protein
MVNPNLAPGLPRSNAVNTVNVPTNAAPLYRPSIGGSAQPTARPLNAQVVPGPQRAQVGPRVKGPPPEKCAGRGCRH